jgi:hypothetical protein
LLEIFLVKFLAEYLRIVERVIYIDLAVLLDEVADLVQDELHVLDCAKPQQKNSRAAITRCDVTLCHAMKWDAMHVEHSAKYCGLLKAKRVVPGSQKLSLRISRLVICRPSEDHKKKRYLKKINKKQKNVQ